MTVRVRPSGIPLRAGRDCEWGRLVVRGGVWQKAVNMSTDLDPDAIDHPHRRVDKARDLFARIVIGSGTVEALRTTTAELLHTPVVVTAEAPDGSAEDSFSTPQLSDRAA